MDETCARLHEHGLNIQSNKWCHHGSPCPQKLWQEQGQLQVMLMVACDYKGILPTHAVTPWHNTQHCTVSDHILCVQNLLCYSKMVNCHIANTVTYLFGSSGTSTLITRHEPLQKKKIHLGDIDLSTTGITRAVQCVITDTSEEM